MVKTGATYQSESVGAQRYGGGNTSKAVPPGAGKNLSISTPALVKIPPKSVGQYVSNEQPAAVMAAIESVYLDCNWPGAWGGCPRSIAV